MASVHRAPLSRRKKRAGNSSHFLSLDFALPQQRVNAQSHQLTGHVINAEGVCLCLRFCYSCLESGALHTLGTDPPLSKHAAYMLPDFS